MNAIYWLYAAFGCLAAIGGILYVVFRDRKPEPAPVQRQQPITTGPNLDVIRSTFSEVHDGMTVRQNALIERREAVRTEAQNEIDRLTIEIANAQIAIDTYVAGASVLNRGIPVQAPTVPDPLMLPSEVEIDSAELTEALTADGMIGGGEPIEPAREPRRRKK